MRVIHVPDAVGGQAAGLARAEREIGLQSVAVALEPSSFGYAMDEIVREGHAGRIGFELARMRLLARALRDFDVVHFNFGRTILPPPPLGPASLRYRAYSGLLGLRDLPLLARAGKVIAVTFQGDDVRQGDVLRASYERSVATANPGNYAAGDDAKRRIAAAFDRYADSIYFLNPDLARVLPARAEFLPYASVDPREWTAAKTSPAEVPLVVHAPSDRLTKGTRHVLEAVSRLRAEGVSFEFRLVEGLTQTGARRVYEQADVFIDQLHVGWYGAAAVEAMALAKPVLCFLRPADFSCLPDGMAPQIPIVGAGPETLVDRLREVIAMQPSERRAIGDEGRAFVERWHDPRRIAERLRAGYEAAAGSKSRN